MSMNILAKIGLMKRSEHERIVAENDDQDYNRWRLAADQIDAANIERDDWKEKHRSVVSKLDLAAADLAAQAEEIADHGDEVEHLKAELWAATEQARDNARDALLWRAARDKRAARKGAGK